MKRIVYRLFVVVAVTLIPMSCSSARRVLDGKNAVSPLDYGLKDSKTGEERYYVLQRTHQEAERLGAGVSYAAKGIRQ